MQKRSEIQHDTNKNKNILNFLLDKDLRIKTSHKNQKDLYRLTIRMIQTTPVHLIDLLLDML